MLKRDYSSNLETASRHTSALVFEFGQAFVRVGIAGESTPRIVIPILELLLHQEKDVSLRHSFWKSNLSIVGNSNKHYCTSCSILMDSKNKEWKDDDDDDDANRSELVLLPWLRNLYTYQLFIKPKSRRVVVILPISYPPKLQYQLQRTLLEDLQVPSVYFTHVFHTIPYAIGSRTGVIIDIGHAEARVAAYFDGILSEDTLQIVPFGYTNCIHILTSQRNKTREQILNDLHSLDDDDETRRFLYTEYLLNLQFHDSIMYAFLMMLSKCSIDLRRHVLESVSFVGGGVRGLPNFEKEFVQHLIHLYERSPVEESSSLDGSVLKSSLRYPYRVKDRKYARFDCLGISILTCMNVIQLKFHPVSMAWVGGSIMASIKNDRMKWIQRDASK
jgi:actin-related protein